MTARPITLDRARIERQIRELALDHAAGRLASAERLPKPGSLAVGLSGFARRSFVAEHPRHWRCGVNSWLR